MRIGSGSWLGANVIILPGTQIGEHVVVAAGAVVRGEIPDHCVVAGVPAKIVRRFVAGQGWIAPATKSPPERRRCPSMSASSAPGTRTRSR